MTLAGSRMLMPPANRRAALTRRRTGVATMRDQVE
jgi:hypothetical protein